ncbi:tetratricopeptide repeat protein [Flavobacterium sp.]|uniref:type IX secretion system periplasmic lipoprotein PorW/SprE n=1 Tax=Flavobacterium sp. TaxID=239 RepID=UPI003B995641
MKVNIPKKSYVKAYTRGLSVLALTVFIVACSTRKDKFINRQFQALNTKYNALYNGELALDKGLEEVKQKYQDNYWDILPIERMQGDVAAGESDKAKPKNTNFERAELKATKAIQKRSMNIEGKERNPQIDEAHLMLGQARYYDQRYIPALEAFNYILYKYPESDKIYIAKIWRERTNMRLGNDALAVKNLKQLLSEIKFKDQVYADANATIAQAFVNLNQIDSATVRLAKAIEFSKNNEEKARYHFILGQLYERQGKPELAANEFRTVIEMNRKSPRVYIIQAEAKLAQQFDYKSGDTVAFIKHMDALIKDRENRPFLDVLYHQKALFYTKRKKFKPAIENYNKSLQIESTDDYLVASNYRNLAGIYFDSAKYQTAGQYYDSTLTKLKPRTREYKAIEKKRNNLDDVIKYEGIAQRNDSILNVAALSPSDRKEFYEAYIEKLKKSDAEKAKKEKEAAEKAARLAARDGDNSDDTASEVRAELRRNDAPGQNLKDVSDNKGASSEKRPRSTAGASAGGKDGFYFYNTVNVSQGKIDFKKIWGNRTLRDNWRLTSLTQNKSEIEKVDKKSDSISEKAQVKEVEKPQYTADFYLKGVPTSKTVLDSLAKERNFAYFQLGAIYKDKFKEYQLSADKYESLLKQNPEERYILPALYNLYKDYMEINPSKAQAIKDRIIASYPNSRYAQILQNPESATGNEAMTGEEVYNELYQQLSNGDYIRLAPKIDAAISQFTGEEIIPKLELLKATNAGKLNGVTAYKAGLNFVALNFPTTGEGKEAEELLRADIPILEDMEYDDFKPTTYKILYKVDDPEAESVKAVRTILETFVKERTTDALKLSVDIYTPTSYFLVLHNFENETAAKDVATILKEYKDYQIKLPATVMSSENYKVTQVKKNFETYHLPRQPRVKKPVVIKPKPEEKKAAAAAAKPKQAKPQTNSRQNPGMPPGLGNAPNQKQSDKGSRSLSPTPDMGNDPAGGEGAPKTEKTRKP